MLKFFRTIRKKLIEQDNFRKYLLYAMGEILLVVIGILIALQVNNWNEHNKTKLREQTLTASLKEEVALVGEGADNFIEYEESNIQVLGYSLHNWSELSYDMIKGQFRPFQEDNLSPIFNVSSYSQFFDPKMDVYHAAVNDGSLSIIQDKLFIRRLDALYNSIVPRINELMREEYLLSQSINDHIAVRYEHLFLEGTLRDSLSNRPNLWSEDTYEKFFSEIRKDGVLKYKLAHRLELKRTRLLLMANAERFIKNIESE